MIAVDIKVNRQSFNSQNTLDECLSEYCSTEMITLHEVGHAYRLGEFSAWPAAMDPFGCYHSCNVGAGFRSQPMGDDTHGLMQLYGRNWDDYKNLSGMHFYRNADGSNSFTEEDYWQCGQTKFVKFTRFNHYAQLADFPLRVVLIPVAVTTPTASSITWAGPLVRYTPAHSGATYSETLAFTPPWNATAPGVVYRVWIQLDPLNEHNETDEGDNFVPTRMIARGNECRG